MKTVGVIGGGTAGWFSALALKRRFPSFDVTVIESPNIPIIGVGEATTTLMPPFLFTELGLDIVALCEAVKPTWKLGITFEWGPSDDGLFGSGSPQVEPSFTYPFGPAWPVEAMAYDGTLRTQSLTSHLMCAGKSPLIRESDGTVRSLLHETKFAYHLDNVPFVAFLTHTAKQRGITHRLLEIARVETDAPRTRVERLHFTDGSSATFDLYVDASGFRSVLLGDALASPFIDYRSSLFCDSALVTSVPQKTMEPYTTAETMDCGWCWRIPVEGENHRGYVFSSAHLDEATALTEFRRANPTWVEGTRTSLVKFKSGRHADWWKGNVVGIGNAYGFVEPLESTALHMVILELRALCERLAGSQEPERIGAHWDSLRWFLAAHYRFNTRRDSEFWKLVRASVDIGPLSDALEKLRTDGPWLEKDGSRFTPDDPTFGHAGLMMILLGQRVEARAPKGLELDAKQWAARQAEWSALTARALPQHEALEWLRANPETLRASTRAPSWMLEPD
ncbi:MAG: tryptophan 7-halogenase [Archangium sp.]|nr:tryptophan 7-halogenase [Archangium sp.]